MINKAACAAKNQADIFKKQSTYVLFAVITMLSMSFVITGSLLKEIAETFSLTTAESGLIFMTNFIGFTVLILAGGVLADHWGKRKVLLIALTGLSLSLALFALSPSFLLLCIITVFFGGFCGIVESLAHALVADINPKNRSLYINLGQVFFGLGALIGPLLASVVVSSGAPWQLCYYILAFLVAVVTVLFFSVKLPELPPPDKIEWIGFKKLFGDFKFILICLCMLFYTGAEVGGWGWMSTFLKDNMGFSIQKTSLAVSVFWISMTAGRMLFSALLLKFKMRNLIILLALLSSAVTVLGGFVQSEWEMWAVIVLLGLTYSSQYSLMLAYGGIKFPKYSGTVFALFVGSGGIGMTLIPVLMGVIGQYIGIRIAMMSPAILLLLIFAIFIAIERPEKVKGKESL